MGTPSRELLPPQFQHSRGSRASPAGHAMSVLRQIVLLTLACMRCDRRLDLSSNQLSSTLPSLISSLAALTSLSYVTLPLSQRVVSGRTVRVVTGDAKSRLCAQAFGYQWKHSHRHHRIHDFSPHETDVRCKQCGRSVRAPACMNGLMDGDRDRLFDLASNQLSGSIVPEVLALTSLA